MTEEEKHIWRAAYASAFAAQFELSRRQVGFDKAHALSSAELPIAVADLAIKRLREWCAQEKPLAGVELVYE